jgi:hypothetical protein
MWAIEFEKKFNNKSEFDYFIEIDNFYEEKKKQVLAYKE